MNWSGDAGDKSPEEAIGDDTSFEAFYTTLYMNVIIGLVGFLLFCALRPVSCLGFRQFFAPVCFTPRNRAFLAREVEARRHGRPHGSPGASAIPASLAETACYPFHSGWFGWILPTLRCCVILATALVPTLTMHHRDGLPPLPQLFGREGAGHARPGCGDVLPLSPYFYGHGAAALSPIRCIDQQLCLLVMADMMCLFVYSASSWR